MDIKFVNIFKTNHLIQFNGFKQSAKVNKKLKTEYKKSIILRLSYFFFYLGVSALPCARPDALAVGLSAQISPAQSLASIITKRLFKTLRSLIYAFNSRVHNRFNPLRKPLNSNKIHGSASSFSPHTHIYIALLSVR